MSAWHVPRILKKVVDILIRVAPGFIEGSGLDLLDGGLSAGHGGMDLGELVRAAERAIEHLDNAGHGADHHKSGHDRLKKGKSLLLPQPLPEAKYDALFPRTMQPSHPPEGSRQSHAQVRFSASQENRRPYVYTIQNPMEYMASRRKYI